MTKVVYTIVQHDGGWAYQFDGSFSETYPSHDEAADAAHKAAQEQRRPGETTAIAWEDEKGVWHEETARGGDRPKTEVRG